MSITLYPTPSTEGVAKLQAYYRTRCQMEVSEETAFEVLSGIMRFLYLTEVRPPTPNQPTTTSAMLSRPPDTVPAIAVTPPKHQP